jgi:heme exporter protein CcmD
MEEFLAMGGYAKYVWGSYGVSFIALVTTLIVTKRNFAATRKKVLRQVQSMEGNNS